MGQYSQKTYRAWYGDTPHSEIRLIAKSLQSTGSRCAGSGFSLSALLNCGSLKSVRVSRHGPWVQVRDPGESIFSVGNHHPRQKRPPVLFLENVKNLLDLNDQGRTWKVIRETLEDLDYWVFTGVIDAAGWVPQHRERVYLSASTSTNFRRSRRSSSLRNLRGKSRASKIFWSETPIRNIR